MHGWHGMLPPQPIPPRYLVKVTKLHVMHMDDVDVRRLQPCQALVQARRHSLGAARRSGRGDDRPSTLFPAHRKSMHFPSNPCDPPPNPIAPVASEPQRNIPQRGGVPQAHLKSNVSAPYRPTLVASTMSSRGTPAAFSALPRTCRGHACAGTIAGPGGPRSRRPWSVGNNPPLPPLLHTHPRHTHSTPTPTSSDLVSP